MAERIESVGVINIQTNNAEKNTQSLKARMKEVREEMQRLAASGDRTSEAYQRLAQESGELARVQREVAKDTAEASTTFSNTIGYTAGALAGVSGAVQTATAALSMMGVEMGDDSEMMKKLVAAMSITSGLQAIQNGVEAFKLLRTNIMRSTLAQQGLNAAMKANPIGAALAVVVALAAAFTTLANNIWSSKGKIESLNTEFERMKETQKGIDSRISSEERYMKALGMTTEQIRENTRATLENAVVEAKALENKAKYIRDNQTWWDSVVGNAADAEEAYADAIQYTLEMQKKLDDYNKNVRIEDMEAARQKRENAAKAWADRKKQLEAEKATQEEIRRYELEHMKDTMTAIEYNEELLKLENAKLAVIQAQDDKVGEGYTSKAYIEQQKVVDALTKSIEKLKQAEIDAMDKSDMEESNNIGSELYNQDRLEADTIYMQRKKAIYESGETDISNMLNNLEMQRFFNEKSLLEEQYNYGLLTKEEYEKQLTQIELKESEKRRQIADDERKKKEEITKLQQQNIMELTSGVSSLLGGIADNLKEDTQAYKNLKAAQAIIDTLSAATAAFSGITETTGGWGIAAAIAQAAAVTATGMANVRKIYAVDTNGGTNNTNVSTAAVGTLNRNYTNTRLTDGSGAEIDLSEQLQKGIGSIRVWVSERDITNAQDNAQKVVVRNTF